ncbi:DUF423 domain-containing protein [Pseudoxanthomonas japonensis]|uniref:DUF423 domain-containing protein n=1 Tax=Pseudoxanthomonas japonensis TaxID=69284 RepID=A0ABQ6ZL48_9GAMM|nr:DUF423 domain-containing protein [Pseudoxanthomonas japonensis]KAF1726931.1 hypothetical protein CSC78_02175 [Pseudoxanthomonas japonensis]
MNYDRRQRKPSFLALTGGLLAAVAVGLSAYASHGVAIAQSQSHVQMAALFAFGHGLALAALAPGTTRRLGTAALCLLLLGTLLFAGSLVGGALFGLPTRLAPTGGTMLMLGWVLWAVDAIRR